MTTPLASALTRVGDRWSLLIVDALLAGPLRFADLEAAVAGISTNILAARLRHLESEGVVLAIPYNRRPRRFAYELSAAGRDLAGAVRSLAQWSADHPAPGQNAGAGPGGSEGAEAGAPRHALCGTPMQTVWWCPTCETPGGSEPTEAVWI